MGSSDDGDTAAAVAMDLELWALLRELVQRHEGASVAARVVAVSAQLCARLGIPDGVSIYAFTSNLRNEQQVMRSESN